MSATNQQRFHASLEAQKRGLTRGTNVHQAFVDGYALRIEETAPKPYTRNDQKHFDTCTEDKCRRCKEIRRAKSGEVGVNWCEACWSVYFFPESHAHICQGLKGRD